MPKQVCLIFVCLLLLLGISLPISASAHELKGIRGAFFDFVDDPWQYVGHEEKTARFFADGLLVLKDGIIQDFGPYAETIAKYPDLDVITFLKRIILPGFIDGHTHFVQTRIIGEYGLELPAALEADIFPEEVKYKDKAYSVEGAEHYFDNLLASGTTTVQDFGVSFPSAIEAFFAEAQRRNMRVICGLSGIDCRAPAEVITQPEQFYMASKELIEKYHRHGRCLYAITPRFAYGASSALMQKCAQLHKEFPDCWVNTHVAENARETKEAAAIHGCPDYLACYEKYGLVGPKFTAGHGIWLSDSEFKRLSQADASISFCPNSNMYMGNGFFRLGAATNPLQSVRLSFGSDIGCGNSFSMVNVLNQAYKVGMCNRAMLSSIAGPKVSDKAEVERNKLNVYRAFYSITLGGAHGLCLDHLIGNFGIGKEADFVVLDWRSGPPALAWHQSLVGEQPLNKEEAAKLLFGVMSLGDDRIIDETWIMGKRLYKRRLSILSN